MKLIAGEPVGAGDVLAFCDPPAGDGWGDPVRLVRPLRDGRDAWDDYAGVARRGADEGDEVEARSRGRVGPFPRDLLEEAAGWLADQHPDEGPSRRYFRRGLAGLIRLARSRPRGDREATLTAALALPRGPAGDRDCFARVLVTTDLTIGYRSDTDQVTFACPLAEPTGRV